VTASDGFQGRLDSAANLHLFETGHRCELLDDAVAVCQQDGSGAVGTCGCGHTVGLPVAVLARYLSAEDVEQVRAMMGGTT